MKFNLRVKLIGGYAVILLLIVVVGLVGIYTSNDIKNRLEKNVRENVKASVVLGDVARNAGFIHSNSLLHLLRNTIDDMNRYESEIADREGEINRALNTLKNMNKDQTRLDKLAEFRAAWDTYLRIWKEQVVPLSRANREEEAFALVRKGGAAGVAVREAMGKLDELNDANVAAASHSLELVEQGYRTSQIILLATIFIVFIIGLFFGIKYSSLIAGAVNTVSKAAQRVAAGDLDQSVTVKTGDEIESMADSFNTMTENMKKMVEELRQEITERKRAEEVLCESEQRLYTTLKSIGEAVIVTDAKGLVTIMNSVAESLTGWEEAEAVGKPLEDVFNIINEQTGERAENPVGRVLREGVVVGLANDTVLIARDGTKRPIADSGAPIKNEKGNIIGTVVVFRDTTERKQAEEALRESYKELKTAQEQLVRHEKLAALGQLAGGVGHELRNPLGVISNAIYFLQMTLSEADGTTREYLEMISSEVSNADKIISDLLDFSRVKAVEREETSVSGLVSKVLEKQPTPENAEVTTAIPPDLPAVFVDSVMIGQVLSNLVTNACQAMPEGGKLTISAQAEKEKVSLSITDTGCGISRENMKNIFEPLFTTKARGIGLGLSVSRSLAEANGGSIKVESEEGKGSTFTLILPTREAVS
ncbi:MAG: ATP-binding protein [Desulfobacteraceae bacterium]|nr:ATP-binding protein [Desulfobacteraceae bacterium]